MFNPPLDMRQEALLGGLDMREEAVRTLKEIETYDRLPGGFNSIIAVSERFVDEAAAMRGQIDREGIKGPLHGARILLKDNIDTADGMATSAGSLALAENVAPRDATIVERLRAAGALIVGKTNMTEFANYMGKEMANGYSSRGGQVLCPYDRNADPSGSSTGSAVAACVGFCDVAIGTETSGSIVSPATHQGIVGLKPTAGRVSRAGIIPISRTLDTAGPMGRHAMDCAKVLAAIAGEDARDETTLGLEPFRVPALPRDLRGLRIGVMETEIDSLSPARRANLEISLSLLSDDGAELIRGIQMERWTKFGGDIMREEFRESLNAYLKESGVPDLTLADIIAYNKAHPDKCLRYGQATLIRAQETQGGVGSAVHRDALAARSKKRIETVSLFSRHKIDALILATSTDVPPIIGLPSIVVPNGMNGKLPTALYMMAPPCREDVLLSVAMAYERLRGAELRPSLFEWGNVEIPHIDVVQ